MSEEEEEEKFETFATKQSQVAEFFGRQPGTVKDWRTAGMPGTPGRYPLGEIARWLRSPAGPWSERITPAGHDDDPFLSGVGSPALERYRAAKASQEEIKLEEMRHSFVSVASTREGMEMLASRLRHVVDRLQSRFGAEAAEMFNEALDDFKQEVDSRWGGDDAKQ